VGLKKAVFVTSKKPQGSIQKAMLFNLGKATSLEPTWYGITKFAKAPNKIGTTTKKTIIKP